MPSVRYRNLTIRNAIKLVENYQKRMIESAVITQMGLRSIAHYENIIDISYIPGVWYLGAKTSFFLFRLSFLLSLCRKLPHSGNWRTLQEGNTKLLIIGDGELPKSVGAFLVKLTVIFHRGANRGIIHQLKFHTLFPPQKNVCMMGRGRV